MQGATARERPHYTVEWSLSAFAVLLLMALFYPITLSKFAFFAPIWILTLLIFSRFFEPRISVVLSLFLPMAVGFILIVWSPLGEVAKFYYGTVNIRMVATPSGAMDVYNDFFSSHPLTYFCQISFLKPLMACAYSEQISVVMEKQYALGAFNASLFATEGIASVGLLFAPLAVVKRVPRIESRMKAMMAITMNAPIPAQNLARLMRPSKLVSRYFQSMSPLHVEPARRIVALRKVRPRCGKINRAAIR